MLLFIIVSAGYILGSYQLILTNDHLADRKQVPFIDSAHYFKLKTKTIHTNNQYAYLCYVVRCFISLYNLILDHGITRILHFQSFHDHYSLRSVRWNHRISSPLPFHRSPWRISCANSPFRSLTNRSIGKSCSSSSPSSSLHSLSWKTLRSTLLSSSLFHRLLVGVSSLGMLAMVASLVILFIFGLYTSQFRWKNEYLFPHSTSGFLSNLGLFVHSLAFILFLLSNTVDGYISVFSIETLEKAIQETCHADNRNCGGRHGSDLCVYGNRVFAAFHRWEW